MSAEKLMEDAFSIISEELEKIPGPTKRTGSNIFICCPFHDDKSPSLSINMSFEAKVRIGTFMCFGCPAKGGWNQLAEKLGLREIADWQHFKSNRDGDASRERRKVVERVRLNNYSIDRLFEEVGGAVLPWPAEKDWRGYPGKMIERVEGYMYVDQRNDDRDLMLVLPVYINGRYRGGVKALQEKPKDGPSYINTGGDWVLDYGLLGYDFIQKYDLFGCKAVVLVEGPRDWLRMALNKIPACGILGSKMFAERKLMLLMGLGIEKIYTLTDNDSAGGAMAKLVQKVCEGQIDCEELKLPRKKDDKGKLIKMDPDDAPQSIIDKVKAIVYQHKAPEKPKKKRKKK